jgi:hypothetical protein
MLEHPRMECAREASRMMRAGANCEEHLTQGHGRAHEIAKDGEG